MPTTISNEASTTYELSDVSANQTVTSNEHTMVLEDSQGLTITKTGSLTEFVAGDIITYTVQITNNSSSFLTGVRIIDNLGMGNLAYVVGSASLTVGTLTYPVTPVATNPLTFTLQQLNVGASMTLTYRAQVIFNLPPSVNSITNSVQGIGYTSTGTINGFSSFTIQKKNNLEFSITKSASETSVLPNQIFSYFLTLTNGNNTEAVALSTTDQLPANFNVVSVSVRIGAGPNTMLDSSDYTLSGTNLLTINSSMGLTISVPANGNSVITITGYFN